MAEVVKTVFTCAICGEFYFTEEEAEACLQKCKRKQYELIDREKWYENNPPKFKVGDIVETIGEALRELPNQYFRVIHISKASDLYRKPHWRITGNTGYTDGIDIDFDASDSCAEDNLRLVMTCEQFEKKAEKLRYICKCKHKNDVRFCRNRRAFQVIVPCNIGEEE